MIDNQTDKELMVELGARLRAMRISRNITVREAADRAELHVNTVLNAEAGRNPGLATIIRLLRVLGRLSTLGTFLPVPIISPLDAVKRRDEPRKKASSRRRA